MWKVPVSSCFRVINSSCDTLLLFPFFFGHWFQWSWPYNRLNRLQIISYSYFHTETVSTTVQYIAHAFSVSVQFMHSLIDVTDLYSITCTWSSICCCWWQRAHHYVLLTLHLWHRSKITSIYSVLFMPLFLLFVLLLCFRCLSANIRDKYHMKQQCNTYDMQQQCNNSEKKKKNIAAISIIRRLVIILSHVSCTMEVHAL